MYGRKLLCAAGLALLPTFFSGCQVTQDTNPTEADRGPGVRPDLYGNPSPTPAGDVYSEQVRHTFSEVGKDFDPFITSDGKRILFASTRISETSDVFIKDANSKVVTQVTHTPYASEKQPQLSPDGSRVIYASNKEGKWNIYETSFLHSGSIETEIVSNGRINEQPCYSPDGRHITYVTWIPRKSHWEIATMNLKTQQEKIYGPGLFPKFSPDGTKLVFQRPRSRSPQWFSIWLLDLRTENISEIISNNNWAAVTPNWSPDGRKIIFGAINKSIYENGAYAGDDIFTISVDGTHLIRLTNDGAPDWNPIWAKDGRVFYVSMQNGFQNIWSIKPRDMDPYHPDTLESGLPGMEL
ncbi:MAG: PD40 domain-containing protein [Planctomycetes bacterium]|nr:PD40 domain-containing protein [Planctomycetota bacterium]